MRAGLIGFTATLLLSMCLPALAEPPSISPAPGVAEQSSPKPSPACDPKTMRYYPERALRLGVQGYADIQCRVTNDGHLADCVATSENPTGYGFGQKAVEMSCALKLKLGPDGKALGAGGTFKKRINFNLQ